MELIKITEQNGNQAVSARELHIFLEVKTNFTDWVKRMFDYGFEENKDYIILLKNGENKDSNLLSKNGKQVVAKNDDNLLLKNEKQVWGGHNKTDYALTLDTAKEISMLQRSEKGKQARTYFIACEKKVQQLAPPSRKELALMVLDQEEKIERLQAENDKLKPRSDFVEKVFNTDGLIAIGEVAKILQLPYGRNTLFVVLREKGILFKTKNEPMQQFVTKGYFELKEKFVNRNNHPPMLIIQTFVTQKGLGFIAKTLNVVQTVAKRVKMIND